MIPYLLCCFLLRHAFKHPHKTRIHFQFETRIVEKAFLRATKFLASQDCFFKGSNRTVRTCTQYKQGIGILYQRGSNLFSKYSIQMTEKRNRPEGKAADGGDGMDGIFDDGDEMDMDTTMTTNDDKEGEATSAEVKSVTNKSYFSPQLLAQYYSRLFPFDLLHEWLSYDPSCNQKGEQKSQSPTNTKIFSRREFSFTIEPIPGEEIYIRYQSFLDQAELTNAVLKRNPHKIDIGAIFSHPPKDHHAIQGSTQRKFAPVQRELVFDVDLTDYDGVRKCGCSAANICTKCWKMMGMAMKVMDVGLKEDFGFKNIAWFYSGRRGIHAWICDESARELSDPGRSAVASYFEVRTTMYFTVTTCVDTIYFEKVRAWASYTY